MAAKNRDTGRGLTVAEIADAYTATFGLPLPKAFTSRVHSLVKGGILVAVGGRASRTQYAHRDVAVTPDGGMPETEEDDVLIVLGACRAAATRFGRHVSTREVGQEIQRMGLRLISDDINAVRRALGTLSRTRRRGPEAWRDARLERTTRAGTTGHGSAWWWPVGLERPPVTPEGLGAAFSRSAAIRAAILRCAVLVGRPVSRREFRWWVLAGGAPHLPRATLATDLDRAAHADRRAVAGGAPADGRLERIEGDLTAFGGAPARFAVTPFDHEQRLACLVEDACVWLQIDDELAGIARLRRHAERRRSAALAHFASVREGLLQNAFDRLTLRLTWQDRLAAIDRLRATLHLLDLLILEGSGGTQGGENLRREIATRRRHLEAVALWQVPDDRGALEGRAVRWRLLGVATVGLQPYLAAAELDLGQPVAWHKLLFGARRVPPPKDVPIARPGDGGGPPPILVDRVDALLALYRRVPVARANALLSSAKGLLGQVVRDPAMVRACFREAVAHGDATTRRAAIVSLGMLGDLAEDDVPALGADEMPDMAAILLAIILSNPEECADWIGRLTKELRNYAARRLAETAHLRVQRGRLISAIG